MSETDGKVSKLKVGLIVLGVAAAAALAYGAYVKFVKKDN